jgi:hypothetical protein
MADTLSPQLWNYLFDNISTGDHEWAVSRLPIQPVGGTDGSGFYLSAPE